LNHINYWEEGAIAASVDPEMIWINDKIGWSVGSNVMKTTDGGDTWTIQNSDFYSRDVYFLDKNLGWVLGYS
jgi:photosystem II stability/assembly factor-like uncharacterized protein